MVIQDMICQVRHDDTVGTRDRRDCSQERKDNNMYHLTVLLQTLVACIHHTCVLRSQFLERRLFVFSMGVFHVTSTLRDFTKLSERENTLLQKEVRHSSSGRGS